MGDLGEVKERGLSLRDFPKDGGGEDHRPVVSGGNRKEIKSSSSAGFRHPMNFFSTKLFAVAKSIA